MSVGDAAREPHGDPQTHLDTDPVNAEESPDDDEEDES
jgi:hypothetical protein